jgi:hypothetical protein
MKKTPEMAAEKRRRGRMASRGAGTAAQQKRGGEVSPPRPDAGLRRNSPEEKHATRRSAEARERERERSAGKKKKSEWALGCLGASPCPIYNGRRVGDVGGDVGLTVPTIPTNAWHYQ